MSEASDERPIAIIDGSNVAHATEGDRPVLENIRLVSDKLRAEGYQSVVVVVIGYGKTDAQDLLQGHSWCKLETVGVRSDKVQRLWQDLSTSV